MDREQTTDELLAIRYPHSYHLFPKIEKACAEISQAGGWGIFSINFQGFKAGRLLARFVDLQRRIFYRDEAGDKT